MSQIDDFRDQVSSELVAYCDQQRSVIRSSYGSASLEVAEQLFDEVLQDNDHYPGVLVLLGYTLEQGEDLSTILPAARAIELLGAATRLFDAGHIAAGQFGQNQAIVTLANLPNSTESDRIKAVSITSHSALLRAHGVINSDQAGHHSIWRGAHFMWLNPVHVGMVLAGADCHGTDDITAFMLALGAGQMAETKAMLTALEDRWPNGVLLHELYDDVVANR